MTRQIRDTLIYNDNEYGLNEELLEPYFRDFPEKRPPVTTMMTALWRGYIATFEIVKDELFVKNIEVFGDIEKWTTESVLGHVFPGTNKFEWYSGLVRIDEDRGEFDFEKHGDEFRFLEIRDGNLLRERVMTFEELQLFKAEQFEYFKMSKDYEAVYNLWKNNNKGITDAEIDGYILDGILRYTREVFVD